MTELKDWLNSINFNKTNLIEEDPSTIKDYAPYIINRCLSGNIDSILFANEMNKYSFLDKDIIKQYYGYSNEKASNALKILTPEQINFIKQRLETGGSK